MLLGSVVATLLVQTTAPPGASWTMEVGGAPLAVVRTVSGPGWYGWGVESFFRRGETRLSKVAVDAKGLDAEGRVPESLWFLKGPNKGCVTGIDEETRRVGQLCMNHSGGDRFDGTAFGVPFTATYLKRTYLYRLEISGAVYLRGLEQRWVEGNPWGKGFPVEGSKGRLVIDPRPPGAEDLEPRPRATGKAPVTKDCLTLAREMADASAKAKEVVMGLVIDEGRAYPHAWVREVKTNVHEDPSVPEGEGKGRRYVLVPRHTAGLFYVQLLNQQVTFSLRE